MPDTASLLGPTPHQSPATRSPSTWCAELALGYEHTDGRTTLARRHHLGPLVVQKPLYPEGDAVCHTIVVHPPGGIAGGDNLDIAVDAGTQSHILLTTPGATKWYKANNREAKQRVRLALAANALVEWLPQETILFDGTMARITLAVDLAKNARYFGWDITVLGRQASGESFDTGSMRQQTVIRQQGREIFSECAALAGSDDLLVSPVGLAGCHVSGTMLVAGDACPAHLLDACREIDPDDKALHSLTRLPGALVARYLGSSPQSARAYFAALWFRLRPWFAGREAVTPRIWRT